MEEEEHEVDFEALHDAANVFEGKTGVEAALVLPLQFGNLVVDFLEVFLVVVGEASCPSFQSGDVAEESDEAYDHAVFVAADEEVDAGCAEAEHEEEDDAHADAEGKDAAEGEEEIDEDAGGPEPEVGEDVHHGEEQHGGSGALGADVGFQLHDLVGFAAHESGWRGVVEREAGDGELEDAPEGNGAWT